MFAILHALGMFVADLFKSRSRLEAENLLLRHQLTIALRQAPPRFRLRGGDRALLIWHTVTAYHRGGAGQIFAAFASGLRQPGYVGGLAGYF